MENSRRKRILAKLRPVVELGKIVFHWGFVPTVLYLGFTQGLDPGAPPPTLSRYLFQLKQSLVCLVFIVASLFMRTVFLYGTAISGDRLMS